MVDSLVDVDSVTVMRQGRVLISDVTLRIGPGERWAVVGPNGAGKSTALGVLTARVTPTAGTVSVQGNRIHRATAHSVRATVQAIDSTTRVDQNQSVLNVVLGTTSRVSRRPPPTARLDRAVELLTELGMQDHHHSPWSALTRGQRQCVLLVRALMARPKVLLLDDLVSGLDSSARGDWFRALEKVQVAVPALAVVVAAHSLDEAPADVTHVLVMRDGRVSAIGRIEEILTASRITDSVVGLSSGRCGTGLRDPSPVAPHSTDAGSTCIVIGDSAAADRAAGDLTRVGATAVHLRTPHDGDLSTVLGDHTRWVAILVHDDIRALRYALACAHLAPDASILVTIFDRTIGDEVRRLLPHCEVTSPADLAVPLLTKMCVGDLDAPSDVPLRRARLAALIKLTSTAITHLTGFVRTTDVGARMMLVGLIGLVTVVVVDMIWLVAVDHRSTAEALHEAVRVVTTVGPAEEPHHPVYAVLSALCMFVTIILSAIFTAGVIDRSIGPRLLGLLGPRSLPRSGHVIVVGLGQVGARLCIRLREMGVPVLAVERDHAAPGLRIIHDLQIPTIVGHGIDRALLHKARLSRASAVAAVGSSELDNLSIAVAAHGIADRPRIVLRAGEKDTAVSTHALLPLGSVCDVTALAADYVVRRILNQPAKCADTQQRRHQPVTSLPTDEESQANGEHSDASRSDHADVPSDTCDGPCLCPGRWSNRGERGDSRLG